METHLWDHLGRCGNNKKIIKKKSLPNLFLWTRGIPAYTGIFSSKYEFPSYLVLMIHKLPTTSCIQKAISFSTLDHAEMPVGFTRTPRTSELFWSSESVHRAAESVPARMMRQECCQLPFSCRSSSYLHKHTGTTPTRYLATADFTLLNTAVKYRNHFRAQQQSHT